MILKGKNEPNQKKRLSKRAQKKLDKIMGDSSKSEIEKKILSDQLLGVNQD